MPNYRGHLFGAGAIYCLIIIFLIKVFNIETVTLNRALIWLSMCLLGSLFPDIDTKSKGQKIFYSAMFLFVVWLASMRQWVLLSLTSAACFVPILARHRSIAHRLWFVLSVPAFPTYFVASRNLQLFNDAIYCYLFFVIGAISHLVLDFGLVRFLRINFPFKKRRW